MSKLLILFLDAGARLRGFRRIDHQGSFLLLGYYPFIKEKFVCLLASQSLSTCQTSIRGVASRGCKKV